MSIYTPRASIDMMQSPQLRNMAKKAACTVIKFHGYEVSIAMETIGEGDLPAGEIQVYVENVNLTNLFLLGGEHYIRGDGDRLHILLGQIDKKYWEIDVPNGEQLKKEQEQFNG